jgi:inner membrane protein
MVATACFVVYKDVVNEGVWEFSLPLLYEYLVIMVGVLLPDIDHPESTIGSRVKWASYPIYFIFGHRKLTHSIIFVGGLYWLGFHYELPLICLLAVGAALHLVGDYLTPSGIPLFFPFGRNYRAIVNAKTNTVGEHILSYGALVGALFFVLN